MTIKNNFIHLNNSIPEANLKEIQIDGKRFYSTPDGDFPSVTTVVGFEKQKFFSEWRRKNPEESKRVTSRGTKFHSLIEKYLKNEPIELDDQNSNLKALFNLLLPELNKIDNITALETPLWSKILRLAGRTDCIAEYDGKLYIIYFKAISKEKKDKDIENYFMQENEYAIIYKERTGVVIDNFAILIASEDGFRQVFQGKPIKYIKSLKQIIKRYHDGNL